jgi:uncharacterized protein (TIGR02145 family)
MEKAPRPINLLTGVMLISFLQAVNASQLMIPSDCPNLTGQIRYLNAATTPLFNVQVCLQSMNGDTVQVTYTDYQGNYSFCINASGTYLLTVSSTRPAGGINATDALFALKHFVGDITLSGLNLMAADIDNSGFVNSTDALMILRRYVGQINTFSAGDWVFEMAAVSITGNDALVQNLKGLCYGDLNGSYVPPGCTPMPTQSNAGPDQSVSGTSTVLAGNAPISGTGIWSILSGENGMLDSIADPQSLFTGIAGNTYELAWTISTICTSATDTVMITFATPSFTCGSAFTDTRDGQLYNTIQIGAQCWMQQNLNIGTMVMDHYTGILHSHCSNNGIIEKYCFTNNPANCDLYGGLYDWNELMDYSNVPGIQGICPGGWHIPTDTELCALTTFLDSTINCNVWGWSGTNAGGKMKEIGLTHWNYPNYGATNESGFTALPGGFRDNDGSQHDIGNDACFWSSSQGSTSGSINRNLDYSYADVRRYNSSNAFGYSVRCLKDD